MWTTDVSEQKRPGNKLPSFRRQVNLRRILMATKLSNDLPGEKRADYDYYSTFAGFRAVMQAQVGAGLSTQGQL
jgi:hypothetical protein